MYPGELLEIIAVALVVSIIVICSTFFKRPQWKKYSFVVATVVLLSYCILYIVRPFWIDIQIEKKVVLLETYLEQQHSNEEWTITTVPHRESGYKHLNPYYIGVVFSNEPDVTYHYLVKDEGNITEVGFSSPSAYE